MKRARGVPLLQVQTADKRHSVVADPNNSEGNTISDEQARRMPVGMAAGLVLRANAAGVSAGAGIHASAVEVILVARCPKRGSADGPQRLACCTFAFLSSMMSKNRA
jgi:hypothetical protein